jgi:hypothetical protein
MFQVGAKADLVSLDDAEPEKWILGAIDGQALDRQFPSAPDLMLILPDPVNSKPKIAVRICLQKPKAIC